MMHPFTKSSQHASRRAKRTCKDRSGQTLSSSAEVPRCGESRSDCELVERLGPSKEADDVGRVNELRPQAPVDSPVHIWMPEE